jgi:hypothetical protein
MLASFARCLHVGYPPDQHGEVGTYHADHGWGPPVQHRHHCVDYGQADVAVALKVRVVLCYAADYGLLQEKAEFFHF